MEIKRVVLVFKSHFDIGFTALAKDVLKWYSGEMLESVLRTCKETEDMGNCGYVWTVPAWPLLKMEEACAPEIRPLLTEMIKKRRLRWHALPYTSHYDFCGVEDMIEGLKYSRELAEKYHLPLPVSGKLTDVPGAGWEVPEILHGAGIKFLHMGCNAFACPPDVPGLFWWEAESGARVLTMYSRGGYGSGLKAPDGWPYPVWMALMSARQDNGGPQTASEVRQIVSRARAMYPGAEIICGSLDDFYESLADCEFSTLPVVKKDLADTWIHGVGSYPRESALIRSLRPRILSAEAAAYKNPDKAALSDLSRARELCALYCEHTWGMDVKTFMGEIPDYSRAAFDAFRQGPGAKALERSWREQAARANEALALCERAEAKCSLTPPEKEEAPAFSPCGAGEISNDALRLSWDAAGNVSLSDAKRGQELISSIFYRYDRYSAAEMTEYLRAYAYRFHAWGILDNGRAEYPECAHVAARPRLLSIARAPSALRLTYAGASDPDLGDAREIAITLTLPKGDAPLRITVALSDKRPTPYVESGALCLRLAQSPARYAINKPGCVLDPARDIADNANHAFYALERFAAAELSGALLSVESKDCALLSLGENGVHTFRRAWKETEPEMRFCLFNNMWGTNFPQWIEGDFTFHFNVRALAGGDIAGAYAAACPPAPDAPFAIEGGFECTRFRPENGGWLVRLHSLKNEETTARLRFPGMRLRRVDLMGRALGECSENEIEARVGAYGIVNFFAEK